MTRAIAWWIGLTLLVGAASLACDPSDDDDNDQPGDDDTLDQPDGACVCCFLADEQVWGYCWSVGFADECRSGCEALYDAAHLDDVQWFADAVCLDLEATARCRGEAR
jgi:hypothetical protein